MYQVDIYILSDYINLVNFDVFENIDLYLIELSLWSNVLPKSASKSLLLVATFPRE